MLRSPLGIAVAISLLPVLTAQARWFPRSNAGAPPARTSHALAAGPGNTMVLFGGDSFTGYLGDTWILDAAGWRQMIMPFAPAPQMRKGFLSTRNAGRRPSCGHYAPGRETCPA